MSLRRCHPRTHWESVDRSSQTRLRGRCKSSGRPNLSDLPEGLDFLFPARTRDICSLISTQLHRRLSHFQICSLHFLYSTKLLALLPRALDSWLFLSCQIYMNPDFLLKLNAVEGAAF
ncbi:hypothetical protein M413DRAFT_325338 [Hebeloma cylindrosporum]|uniref:Uncharacterized protein n=1 Tax=Hebeloma cylindrosporum TaxID=76867 RepID=A0A0C3BGF9_HEBCY|nr:hypothetical protein M413DRAFT_325338 [Hebeloma cylindrosporum h7]